MKGHCPICKKSVEWESYSSRPFCSERCRLIDLGNWTMGKYRIEADDKSKEETEEPESPKPPDAEIHNG